MRLDRGPTALFKDFAARMMARLMQYFLKKTDRKLLILVATSGDTGSAIANAFYGLDSIEVCVLFPEKEVSDRQRKQMTTLTKNVRILALPGKFDDCQILVKKAFSDPDLKYLDLSSANSINFGRILPQAVYYFYAYAKLATRGKKVVFSVPSGNFGNMIGATVASRMGLPVERFVIAVNENDEFPKFLDSGKYEKIVPSRNCLSSAMNVGHPSNLARLIDLFGGQLDTGGILNEPPDLLALRDKFFSTSVSDEDTKKTIIEAFKKYGIFLEPHGAVGWKGLERYLAKFGDDPDALYVSVETAHPAKFPEQIISLTGVDPALPPSLQGLEEKPEYIARIGTDYEGFKEWLRGNYK
jgi:threonine synthase